MSDTRHGAYRSAPIVQKFRVRNWQSLDETRPPRGAHVELSYDQDTVHHVAHWYPQDWKGHIGLYWRYVEVGGATK